MKKSLLVLLLAILLPSLVLGWLALRSAQEQQIVLERRTAELCQKETDNVATAARSLISEQRRAFAEILRQLLAAGDAHRLATQFTASLRERWPQPAIGFALTADGRILSPTAPDAAGHVQIGQFLRDNASFVSGKAAVTAYPVPMTELNRPELAQRASSKSGLAQNTSSGNAVVSQGNGNQAPDQKYEARKVAPQNTTSSADSQLTWATADFRKFTAEGEEGVVNRFVDDHLDMIFWVRPAGPEGLVFGCLLRPREMRTEWPALLEAAAPPADRSPAEPDFLLALLDDNARPVAISPAGASPSDWKKPFVATEIGEALPHWEAALYLRHPERLLASARQTQRNLGLLVACALGAIGLGGSVVIAETRRQIVLAQQKTDFVSNVSHELKTPLTSIRMFAELMHTGRAAPARQPEYLRIIMVEAERLTRLINNVLDFARLERREKPLALQPVDLGESLGETWALHSAHLREAGFTTQWLNEATALPILGDPDALAQVFVNLLSNAEKYGGDRREITFRTWVENGRACFGVLDRGPGVPRGEEAKIFAPFYRAHDSLSSGIPGTGLGLSLALRIIREHGGELSYQSRPDGGSNFTVALPLRSP